MTEILSGRTRIYGIIGCPVEHSFSPLMQNAAFDALKIDARYLAFSVKPEQIHAGNCWNQGLEYSWSQCYSSA